ncbi:MAG: hypothetical protein WKG01_05605 [Kofleriaceae bacterium]
MPSEVPEELDSTEQEATDPTTRIYNVVEAVLPAGNHDGLAGDECVALMKPEHRLRKVILVESVSVGGACALEAFAAGEALSFTWGDTAPYGISSGVTALRTALDDSNGAVHRLIDAPTSEAVAQTALGAFLTQSFDAQADQIGTFTGKRVHSLYDFDGDEEVAAEAAYQGVRVTQPCEQPGTPRLEAYSHDGFVYGYIASNSGSCHSGWFSMRHTYNRLWQLVRQDDYSE